MTAQLNSGGNGSAKQPNKRWPAAKFKFARIEASSGDVIAAVDIAVINNDAGVLSEQCGAGETVHIIAPDAERWYGPQQAVRVLLALKAKFEQSPA